MIRREDVADLQPGDVVEYSGHPDLKGAKLVGPLHVGDTGSLCVADYVVRGVDGGPSTYRQPDLTLTVVSRAPRPLYVNHPRTEPVPGDVVRDADDGAGTDTWAAGHDAVGVQAWRHTAYGIWCLRKELPARLRLLVDGETGMPPAVQS